LGRPIAAPLERCAELLGVDLATARELAAGVEPYIRADGTRIWSLINIAAFLPRRRWPAGVLPTGQDGRYAALSCEGLIHRFRP